MCSISITCIGQYNRWCSFVRFVRSFRSIRCVKDEMIYELLILRKRSTRHCVSIFIWSIPELQFPWSGFRQLCYVNCVNFHTWNYLNSVMAVSPLTTDTNARTHTRSHTATWRKNIVNCFFSQFSSFLVERTWHEGFLYVISRERERQNSYNSCYSSIWLQQSITHRLFHAHLQNQQWT